MRSANNPLGNALEHFCGYNYQHHTLDKFLRELKYLGISDRLLREQVSFWRQHWHEFESAGLPFLRSEEHTSELQSRFDLVCRHLLEKKTLSPSGISVSGALMRLESLPFSQY